ncbi:MAG: ribonuclease III [Spirochaetaceae bacterium]|nr:ribonuclease III [Spirochaetaceae bacterium]
MMTSQTSRYASLERIQNGLGVRFSDVSLLDTALTHRSYSNESHGHADNNERLELLGDAVLGLCVAHLLYVRFPDRKEGDLARMKSILVSESVLAGLAEELGIPHALVLGRGEEASGGRTKKAILADALEAVLGALYLDQGIETARQCIASLLNHEIERLSQGSGKDYKTILQEFAQKSGLKLPVYTLVAVEGPEHARIFSVNCTLNNEVYGPYQGLTKKMAEMQAAQAVCEAIRSRGGRDAALLETIASGR